MFQNHQKQLPSAAEGDVPENRVASDSTTIVSNIDYRSLEILWFRTSV
jgi:hypothetical protein